MSFEMSFVYSTKNIHKKGSSIKLSHLTKKERHVKVFAHFDIGKNNQVCVIVCLTKKVLAV